MREYKTVREYIRQGNRTKENVLFYEAILEFYNLAIGSKTLEPINDEVEHLLKVMIVYFKKKHFNYDIENFLYATKRNEIPYYVVEIGCIKALLNDEVFVDIEGGMNVPKIEFLKVLFNVLMCLADGVQVDFGLVDTENDFKKYLSKGDLYVR